MIYLTERGAKVVGISILIFSLLLLSVGCNSNDDNEKNIIIPDVVDKTEVDRKDNELVGAWEQILDTISPEGRKHFYSESLGFMRGPDLYIILNDNEFFYRDFDYYRIGGDTLWVIATERTKSELDGIITKDVLADTLVTRYHLSSDKDTLYFEKIDHPHSRYLPDCFYVGYAEKWGTKWKIHLKED